MNAQPFHPPSTSPSRFPPKSKIKSQSPTSPTNVIELHTNDVVCDGGRGKRYVKHPGNQDHRQQVSNIVSRYQHASRSQKRVLCLQVLHHVHQNKGRFLQLDPVTQNFAELDNKLVLQKITQLFRNQLKEHRKTLALKDLPNHLTKVLSSVSHIPVQQVTTFLTNSTTRNQVQKEFLAFSQKVNQIFQQSSLSSSSLDKQQLPTCHKSNHPSPPPTQTTNSTLFDKNLKNIFNAYTQNPSGVPNQRSLSSSDQPSPCRKKSREFFYDKEVHDPFDWQELLNRRLPSNRVHRIVSMHAFHVHKIHKLKTIKSKTNHFIQKYKCSTCPTMPNSSWWVKATKVTRSPNSEDLWQVSPTISAKCNCCTHAKGKISDQLFCNVSLV